MKTIDAAIVGATGAVGQELIKILTERQFPLKSLKLLASPRSAGKVVVHDNKEYRIEAVDAHHFEGVDICFFVAGSDVSIRWAKIAVQAGCTVIDNSSAFRMHEDVPLVVPEVNSKDVRKHQGIIANPNCSTIIMAIAVKPIYEAVGVRRIVASTYQAVSGAGYPAIVELDKQVKANANQQKGSAEVLPVAGLPKHYPILHNVIPQIDIPADDGYTKEEWKMVHEMQKIFNDKTVGITTTTVRVPVMRCHCISINLQTKQKLSVTECRQLITDTNGLLLIDDLESQSYPMPSNVSGKDVVAVGRIREDFSAKNALNLWVVGDQIRKGAALNAVQIAEILI